ncbi:hypothetical protein ACHAWX_004944 [Stephanocyclus meneghinianus]
MTEVHLAIYDLSMGMARNLSAQFLGPQHAIDIIPHTALIVYGKEYFFGRGIEWCTPQEFRATRGIHPIEVKLLGRTQKTQREFEEWCLEQGRNGTFGVESYDLLSRNCNNFSHEAAIHGLRLPNGIPQWILDVPSKFLSSPMGMMMRPILEGMQLSNNAPTNLPHGGVVRSHPVQHTPVLTENASAVNPWANIPATSTTKAESKKKAVVEGTPILDKQTGPLLSTETGVVPACIAKLVAKQDDLPHSLAETREEDKTSQLLAKLADPQAPWSQSELQIVHQHLQSFVKNGIHLSFALMLLRLAVLKHPSCETPNREQCTSTRLVAELLLNDDNKLSLSNQCMAFCVLSNAIGSNNEVPTWTRNENGRGESDFFLQVIDQALRCCDPTVMGSSSSGHVSLRQSAAAFLYNVARKLAEGKSEGDRESDGLSEATMSILIGCIENIGEEKDVTTLKRRFLCLGQLLKSPSFGKAAASLAGDLGLVDDGFCISTTNEEVNYLAKEVASLLTICKNDT